MVTFRDSDGNELTDAEALALPVDIRYSVEWEDGKSVECERQDTEGEVWKVYGRYGDVSELRGQVSRDKHGFHALGNNANPQGRHTFSEAARKLLSA